jgi:outer membrane biosynthesis protein TonB
VGTGAVDLRFRPLGRGTFFGGFMVTVGVHAFLAGLVYYAHVQAPPAVENERNVLVTRLVVLGKKREKNLLPRIVEPPPPEAPPPQIKVTENIEAPPLPPEKKEPPRPKDPTPSKDFQKAMDRARRMSAVPEEPEGDPLGSRRGTATEASAGDAYATIISDAVASHWVVPTGLSIGEVANLVTDIRIAISDSGELLSPVMKKSSGNTLFDLSCMQAVEAARRVQPPPPSERARWRRGVVLGFSGKDLAR